MTPGASLSGGVGSNMMTMPQLPPPGSPLIGQ
jgi:hypothetical protein